MPAISWQAHEQGCSASAEVPKNFGRCHPDEILPQPAMRVDPGADVRLIGIPEHLRALRTEREMKAQPGVRRDADPAAGNVTEQDRARRLTEPDDTDIHTAGRKARPARVVLRNVATAVTIDVNGFRHHGGGETAHEGGQKPSKQRHGTLHPWGW
jgi:hypothetical protein